MPPLDRLAPIAVRRLVGWIHIPLPFWKRNFPSVHQWLREWQKSQAFLPHRIFAVVEDLISRCCRTNAAPGQAQVAGHRFCVEARHVKEVIAEQRRAVGQLGPARRWFRQWWQQWRPRGAAGETQVQWGTRREHGWRG